MEHLGAKNWKRISEEYLDKKRTDVQCLHRWQKVRAFPYSSHGACGATMAAAWFPADARLSYMLCQILNLAAGASPRPCEGPLDQGRG